MINYNRVIEIKIWFSEPVFLWHAVPISPSDPAMETGPMGLRGNVRASRVWKGEGEEIEQFWPILLTWIGLFV